MKKDKSKKNKACPAKLKRSGGFTLVETLVAIFILVVAVTGPMSAAQNSLRASFLARDQVVAYYLAQEVIEFLKNVRDYESFENVRNLQQTFPQCFNAEPANPKQCNFDVVSSNNSYVLDFSVCGTGDIENISCNPMKINSGGKFVIDGDEVSKYTRAVFLKELTSDEVEAIVVVEWDTNLFLSDKRRVVLQENIYDWIPN